MKVGDLCRCITSFQPIMAEELALQKGELFQVLSIEDKLWVYGIGGDGSTGKVPASCVVVVELSTLVPPAQPHEQLFVVAADFGAQQDGDLSLMKGTVVVGTEALDDSWWRGRAYGKEGIFPANFVWPIDLTLLQGYGDKEKRISKLAKALQSFLPQLDEELKLSPGDVVHITHQLEGDWYRGECAGKVGIFPGNFVQITDHNYAAPEHLNAAEHGDHHSYPTVQHSAASQPTEPDSAAACGKEAYVLPQNQLNEKACPPSEMSEHLTTVNIPMHGEDPALQSAPLSRIQTSWKDSTDDNNDIFDDDYFKVNMPSIYQANSQTSASAGSTNPGSTSASTTDAVQLRDSFAQAPKNERSSLTREVDNYFDHRNPLRPSLSSNWNRGVVNSSRYDHEVDEMLQTGYTEDNTGINPYAKAVYDFSAQYPNELSFRKDEIIHLLKHVDSHWTLGMIGPERGIFPTSYVNIIVDCVHGPVESFLLRPCSTASVPALEGWAVAEHNYVAQEQGDVSLVAGERLKVLELIDDNWAIVETQSHLSGMCPRNHFSMLQSDEGEFTSLGETVDERKNNLNNNQLSDSSAALTTAQPLPLLDNSKIGDLQNDLQKIKKDSFNSNLVSADASKKKRVYSKEDFGPIRSKQLDEELIKNVSSLDHTLPVHRNELNNRISSTSAPEKSDIAAVADQNINVSLLLPSDIDSASLTSSGEETKSTPPVRPPLPSRSSVKKLNSLDKSSPKIDDFVQPKSVPDDKKPSSRDFNKTSSRPSNLLLRQCALQESDVSKPSDGEVCDLLDLTDDQPQIFEGKNVSSSKEKHMLYTSTSQEVNPVPEREMTLSKQQRNQESTVKQTKLTTELSSIAGLPHVELGDKAEARLPHTGTVSESTAAAPEKELIVAKQPLQSVSPLLPQHASVDSADFPLDVSHSAAPTRSASVLAPHRPAPPPPSLCRAASVPAQSLYPGVQLRRAATCTAGARYDIVADDLEHSEPLTAVQANVVAAPPPQEETVHGTDGGQKEKLSILRRELVQELLTTEIEYIHDLEALVQVAKTTSSHAKQAGVDVPTLMGNLHQVIAVAKNLQKALQSVSFNSDEELSIGAVFVDQSEGLCDAYKAYCAHHTTVVEPLLSQYQEVGVKRQYLEEVLKELQQHKIQLLDMRSVLIKPVQRILKYPLFLDRLLSYSPPGEAQHASLTTATQRMADVATTVNTHTKRMDMVRKYGSQTGSSGSSSEAAAAAGSLMGRLSLHSIAKKSARVTTRLSASLGLSSLPEDVHMTGHINEYRALLTDIRTLQQQTQQLQQLLQLRCLTAPYISTTRWTHKSELALTEGLAESLLAGGRLPAESQRLLEAVRTTAREVCNTVVAPFECTMNEVVQAPLQTVMSLTATIDRLLIKREHKLLDYDRAQHKMDRNRDPGRTRVVEEDLLRARSDYDALHSQLLEELPLFNASASAVLANCLTAYLSARTVLQGKLAKKYCALKQDVAGGEDASRQQHQAACESLLRLSFVAAGHLSFRALQTEHPPPTTKHLIPAQSAGARAAVLQRYASSRERLRCLSADHSSSEPLMLTLPRGAVVAVIKDKDPSGSSDRCFVDDGAKTGFVRTSVLSPYHEGGPPPNQRPLSQVTPVPSQPAARASLPVLPSDPPRYEDIFPELPVQPRHRRTGSGSSPVISNTSVFTRDAGYSTLQPRTSRPVQPKSHAVSSQFTGSNVTPLSAKPVVKPATEARKSSNTSLPGGHLEQTFTQRPRSSSEHNSTRSPPSDTRLRAYSNILSAGDAATEAVGAGGAAAPVHLYDTAAEEAGNTDSPPTSPSMNVYEEIVTDRGSSPTYEEIPEGGVQAVDSDVTDEAESEMSAEFYYAVYKFGGDVSSNQLSLYEGQVVLLLEPAASGGESGLPSANEWRYVENRQGQRGYVPASYLAPYSP
ncbi:SH3 domain [Trinorchestia longiramus]|nr:SH3 domain [Trinorchestia longiramus]